MDISLTELRQRLFELADRVIETGEPIIITRRGTRLRITRDEPQAKSASRLAKLRLQELENGPPLDPHESPAQWSELGGALAQPTASYVVAPDAKQPPPSPRSRTRRRAP